MSFLFADEPSHRLTRSVPLELPAMIQPALLPEPQFLSPMNDGSFVHAVAFRYSATVKLVAAPKLRADDLANDT